MESEEAKIVVRNIVKESQNIIRQSEDGKQIKEALQRMKNLMLGKQPDFEGTALRENFLKQYYHKWLNFLVGNCKKEWLDMSENPVPMIDTFFLEGGIKRDAFVALCHSINTTGNGFRFNKMVTILEKFIADGHMQTMILDQCKIVKQDKIASSHQQDELILLISSLPDKITAKLKMETSKMFYPDTYMRRIAGDILASLKYIYSRSVNNKTVSYSFIGQLMGKLCITGHADLIWPTILEDLENLVREDIRWCEVCEKFVEEIPERALESVVIGLVQHANWYGTVARILGENVGRHKVQFLLTNKLILLRHFKEGKILQNVIGCLASSPSRSYLVSQVLVAVLEVWSDGSAVRHTSYDQHLYITKAILVCLSLLSPQEKKKMKSKVLTGMMPGVQVHLDSPLPKMRKLGMLVAESVSSVLDPEGPQLKFEYDKDEESEQLLSFLHPVTTPDDKIPAQNKVDPGTAREKSNAGYTPETNATKTLKEEEDSSDDDLQPYDMSNDVKVSKVKKPLYLRDCMNGLITNDDPEKVEVCLQAAESLIRRHPSSVIEVSVEFAKILLHLQDTGVIDNFVTMRRKAFIALLVTSPKQVATYVTEEFYGANYNIRQRLDILDALVGAAEELSSVQSTKSKDTNKSHNMTTESNRIIHTGEEQDWRKIVEERIAKKTRRFAHGHKMPPPAELSRFAPVAGYFFFSLLSKYDKPELTLDLLGNDHMVLQRLLFSLGIIIHAAVNAPIASQMGAALLKFVWMLRYHPQAGVRRGILFSICMLLLSVPGHILLTDMNEDLVEIKLWLQDVAESDTDQENQKLSLHGLCLMQEIVKKELEKS